MEVFVLFEVRLVRDNDIFDDGCVEEKEVFCGVFSSVEALNKDETVQTLGIEFSLSEDDICREAVKVDPEDLDLGFRDIDSLLMIRCEVQS